MDRRRCSPRARSVKRGLTSAADLLDAAARRLASAGSASARLDATLLLSHATGWSRTELLAHPERIVPDLAAATFDALRARREAGEPIAYILGQREFYGRRFRVDRRALIPRPETEMLVELGLEAVAGWRARGVEPRVVDIGTGSGAIAVSLAAETDAMVLATDASFPALTLARENARSLGQARRVRLAQADLLAGVRGPIHVLLANLPYLPAQRPLPRDVHAYEPRAALVGGPHGRELVERLLRQAAPLLVPGAEMALEIDDGQGAALASTARCLYPDAAVEVLPDQAGLERVLRVHSSTAARAPGSAAGGADWRPAG